MRSRYSAYARGLVDYLLATTDPEGPRFEADRTAWREDVARFCRETRFEGLEVHSASEDGDEGEVVFTVRLRQRGRDAGFTERSRFVRREGRWLYADGSPA